MADSKKKSKGTWKELRRFQDPDSKVTLVLSERTKGKMAHSIQLVMEGDVGLVPHIPMPPKGAKHDLKHIVYSLVEAAEELAASRKDRKS